jgi:hypothetical protein
MARDVISCCFERSQYAFNRIFLINFLNLKQIKNKLKYFFIKFKTEDRGFEFRQSVQFGMVLFTRLNLW